MSILIDSNTKVLVQGITGRDGSFHTKQMLAYGTKVVAGVTPGKGGREVEGVPVFDSVAEAVDMTGATAAAVYVPARFAKDALLEDIAAGIPLIVCITEGIPVLDMIEVLREADKAGVRIVGPNCPGVIVPGRCKIGIMPDDIHKPGNTGVVSRSGTLTYEVVRHLSDAGIGQSACVGLGGDPVVGLRFTDYLKMFMADGETRVVVLVGEIGGHDEQAAAEYIKKEFRKPVVGFIAGQSAPPGRRMGHAGAVISSGETTAAAKIEVLKNAGVRMADMPDDVPRLVKACLNNTDAQ